MITHVKLNFKILVVILVLLIIPNPLLLKDFSQISRYSKTTTEKSELVKQVCINTRNLLVVLVMIVAIENAGDLI